VKGLRVDNSRRNSCAGEHEGDGRERC